MKLSEDSGYLPAIGTNFWLKRERCVIATSDFKDASLTWCPVQFIGRKKKIMDR
jgi:hypothetical protein